MAVLSELIRMMTPAILVFAFLGISVIYLGGALPGLAEWRRESSRASDHSVRSTTVGLLIMLFTVVMIMVVTAGTSSAPASQPGTVQKPGSGLSVNVIQTTSENGLTGLQTGGMAFALGVLMAVGGLWGFGRWRGARVYFEKTKRTGDAESPRATWEEKPKRMDRVRLSDDGELVLDEDVELPMHGKMK